MSDEKDYVDLVFREGGRLRLSGSIVGRFGLELEGELSEKLEQAKMQLEEMVAQRDAAEVRCLDLRVKNGDLDKANGRLREDLRLRDEKYEARCEEMKKDYEEGIEKERGIIRILQALARQDLARADRLAGRLLMVKEALNAPLT